MQFSDNIQNYVDDRVGENFVLMKKSVRRLYIYIYDNTIKNI